MKFGVFDCGLPASAIGYPQYKNWAGGKDKWMVSEFATLQEAIAYANEYLRMYGPLPPAFQVGEVFEYSPGATIEIREII